MLSPLRNRFGIPGVISVIALVFAMLGGAYAASDNGGSGKATASAKKGPRGPRGPKGPAGPAGPQGPVGPQGAKGDTGAAGSNGTNGTNGKNAEAVSFTGAKGPIGGVTCTEGGLEVKSASATTLVCNGKKGTDGQTGFVEELPSGKTLTGVWTASGGVDTFNEGEPPVKKVDNGISWVPVSFPFPVSPAPTLVWMFDAVATEALTFEPGGSIGFLATAEEVDGFCPGSAAAPSAEPGALCVYVDERVDAQIEVGYAFAHLKAPSVDGATMPWEIQKTRGYARGAWAVTAE